MTPVSSRMRTGRMCPPPLCSNQTSGSESGLSYDFVKNSLQKATLVIVASDVNVAEKVQGTSPPAHRPRQAGGGHHHNDF